MQVDETLSGFRSWILGISNNRYNVKNASVNYNGMEENTLTETNIYKYHMIQEMS